MKYVLEFGARGGAHVDNVICPTLAQARKLAISLAPVFTNSQFHPPTEKWEFGPNVPRITWQNDTHFVALSKLDGVMRGPASAQLWRKN